MRLFLCAWVKSLEQFEKCTSFGDFAEFNAKGLELINQLERLFVETK